MEKRDMSDSRIHKPLVTQSLVEGFDGIGQDAGVQPAQGFQLFGCQGIVHSAAISLTSLASTFWPGLICPGLPTITNSPSFNPERTSYLVGVSKPSITVRSSISWRALMTFTVVFLPVTRASIGIA